MVYGLFIMWSFVVYGLLVMWFLCMMTWFFMMNFSMYFLVIVYRYGE